MWLHLIQGSASVAQETFDEYFVCLYSITTAVPLVATMSMLEL